MNKKDHEELFYFMFAGVPLPDNPESYEVGGAYINCWVNENDYNVAENIAKESIEAEKWKIDRLCEWMLCSKKFYLERNDLNKEELKEILNCVNEAFDHGISKVFYCWDIDAIDAGKEYE